MADQEEQLSKEVKGDNKKDLLEMIWGAFSSTKLALFLLIFISVTAIIGTIVPQNPTPDQLSHYSEGWRSFLTALNLFDMYHSKWFNAALALLCVNLFICAIDRLPKALDQIKLEKVSPASGDPERMKNSLGFDVPGDIESTAGKVRTFLKSHGSRVIEEKRGDNLFFLLNMGRYSRLGVHVLHLSIILILLGALVGTIFGYRGSLFVREGESTDKFFRRGSGEQEQLLGFTVACKGFSLREDPETGMTGDYLSKLEISDNGKKIADVNLMVNHPFSYKGIGLYQSSYQLEGVQSALIGVKKKDGTSLGTVEVPNDPQGVEIPGGGRLKLIDVMTSRDNNTVVGAKLELDGGDAGTSVIEVIKGRPHTISSGTNEFQIIIRSMTDGSELGKVTVVQGQEADLTAGGKIRVTEYSPNFEVHDKLDKMAMLQITENGQTSNHRLFGGFPNFDKMNSSGDHYFELGQITQKPGKEPVSDLQYTFEGSNGLYATILDVNYDPGVWLVWAGCIAMFIGLWMAFFWSHRKVWAKVSQGHVSIGGLANRNAQAFETQFKKLAVDFKKNLVS